MLKRPMWMRVAAVAIVLAVASPVWASEMQMREKKDPKAEEQKKQDASKKDAEGKEAKPKKNCPNDIMSFNTLEDMYGFLGTVDSLTLRQTQQAEQANAQAADGTTATQEVLWRTVEKPQADEKKKEQKADPKKAD